MDKVYSDYFQKSKVFLYPLLDFKKGLEFVPKQTYIMWDNHYYIQDRKLLCLYKEKRTHEFRSFEQNVIHKAKLFESHIELDKNNQLFIFDFSSLKEDYDHFIKGEYSRLSIESKLTITRFFGDTVKAIERIDSYLFPYDFHEVYAELLNVDIKLIENVNELCNKLDSRKETLLDIYENSEINILNTIFEKNK
ncbi:MAG: hypothetical protein K0U52_05700 [Gammaproteobacteria bacterium]|nr:hypothetical protein [Gammaproteobacteria bacterium]